MTWIRTQNGIILNLSNGAMVLTVQAGDGTYRYTGPQKMAVFAMGPLYTVWESEGIDVRSAQIIFEGSEADCAMVMEEVGGIVGAKVLDTAHRLQMEALPTRLRPPNYPPLDRSRGTTVPDAEWESVTPVEENDDLLF